MPVGILKKQKRTGPKSGGRSPGTCKQKPSLFYIKSATLSAAAGLRRLIRETVLTTWL